MEATLAADPDLLAHYEGLVRKTAAMYEGIVEEDFDDICQLLRIKVWRALVAFDPTKARQTRDQYVFMCLRNRVKDLVKKVRRNELFIEDIAPTREAQGDGSRDRFEARYLLEAEETVFDCVEKPLIPSTLTHRERVVVAYLYLDYSQVEIAEATDLSSKEIATSVVEIRTKMADWHPSPRQVEQAVAA